jgi:hypothetical protein
MHPGVGRILDFSHLFAECIVVDVVGARTGH